MVTPTAAGGVVEIIASKNSSAGTPPTAGSEVEKVVLENEDSSAVSSYTTRILFLLTVFQLAFQAG